MEKLAVGQVEGDNLPKELQEYVPGYFTGAYKKDGIILFTAIKCDAGLAIFEFEQRKEKWFFIQKTEDCIIV